MTNSNEFLGTGRRKTSVARVRISAGSGKIHVNGRTFEVLSSRVPAHGCPAALRDDGDIG